MADGGDDVAALLAGASGFLLKDAPAADLVAAIRIIAAGDAVVAPAVTRRLLEQFARLPDPGTSTVGTDASQVLTGLTGREVDRVPVVGAVPDRQQGARAVSTPAALPISGRSPPGGTFLR